MSWGKETSPLGHNSGHAVSRYEAWGGGGGGVDREYRRGDGVERNGSFGRTWAEGRGWRRGVETLGNGGENNWVSVSEPHTCDFNAAFSLYIYIITLPL